MKPKSEALAFRVWAYCEPRGWACTPGEIGEALGVHYNAVKFVCTSKGWLHRLSATTESRATGAWKSGAYSYVVGPNRATLYRSQLHDLGVL